MNRTLTSSILILLKLIINSNETFAIVNYPMKNRPLSMKLLSVSILFCQLSHVFLDEKCTNLCEKLEILQNMVDPTNKQVFPLGMGVLNKRFYLFLSNLWLYECSEREASLNQ